LFVAWAKTSGETAWSQAGFGRAMADRGHHKTKSGTIYWLDIEAVKTESDFQGNHDRPNDPLGSEDVPF
jgi:hypothetical protein